MLKALINTYNERISLQKGLVYRGITGSVRIANKDQSLSIEGT